MKRLLGLLSLSLAIFLSPVASADNSPIPMLSSTAQQIIAKLEANKSQLKQNHGLIKQAVREYLLPHVDLQGMSRSVIGRQAWVKASAADRQEFTKVFTELVIRTYANPLAEYSNEKIQFQNTAPKINGRFTRVSSSIIRSNGQNIPLSYSLVLKDNQWKIYDLSVEGVSLLQSFRTQFSQVLQNSNLQNLISQMKQQKVA